MPTLEEQYLTTRSEVNAIAEQAYHQGAALAIHKLVGRLLQVVPEDEAKAVFHDLVAEVRQKTTGGFLKPFEDERKIVVEPKIV